MNAALVPAELTWLNTSFARGVREMVLPRMLSGGVAGAVTAPLITWGVMGVNEAFFGADHTAADYMAVGTRAAAGGGVAGGLGAGTAALSIYLAGGAAAGSWVPILGSLIGASTGLVVYFVVDHFLGDRIEQALRTENGEQHRPPGRATGR